MPGAGQVAAGVVAAAGAAVSAPFYQQDVSPNAHYSSQRSQESNGYWQGNSQTQYQQPSYGSPASQASSQQAYFPQPATSRAFAMVLYISGLIGLIIALCVRDKDDQFITHHINNVLVIFIGCIIGTLLTIVLIGGLVLLFMLVVTIIGMVSAYNGDTRELPLIGKIHLIS